MLLFSIIIFLFFVDLIFLISLFMYYSYFNVMITVVHSIFLNKAVSNRASMQNLFLNALEQD